MDAAEVRTERGVIRIADKALAVIAQEACLSVDGVAGMDLRFSHPIPSRIVGEDAGGVHVAVKENKVSVGLYILACHGPRIPEVALHIQERVKESLAGRAGVTVSDVDVYVQGIVFGQTAENHGG